MYEHAQGGAGAAGNASSRVMAVGETAEEAAAAMAAEQASGGVARSVRNHGALPPARSGRPQSGRKIRFADEEADGGRDQP